MFAFMTPQLFLGQLETRQVRTFLFIWKSKLYRSIVKWTKKYFQSHAAQTHHYDFKFTSGQTWWWNVGLQSLSAQVHLSEHKQRNSLFRVYICLSGLCGRFPFILGKSPVHISPSSTVARKAAGVTWVPPLPSSFQLD